MTDTTTGHRWSFDNYRTLAVTPAPPGWFAIYRWHDGTYSTDPVVAMLTQQYTGTTWHEIVSDSRVTSTDEPAAAGDDLERIVYAVVDRETGELQAVDSYDGRELVQLVTERELDGFEWQQIFAEAQDECDRRKAAEADAEPGAQSIP